MIELDLLIQTLINGLLLGGVYAIVAIGLSLAFGVMGLINVAHGDFIILGALIAWSLNSITGIDPSFMIPLFFIGFFILGYFLQKYGVRRIMGAPIFHTLVIFFALSLIISNSLLLTWGTYSKIASSPLTGTSIELLGYIFPTNRIITFFLSIIVISVLFVFLRRTRTGVAIRAVAQDRDAARLMGVNVERIHSITLGLGIGTCGVAGALLITITHIEPQIGFLYTLFAFFTTVLGGMAYLPGTLVGGIILGVTQSVIATYFQVRVTYLVLFLILFFIIILFPKGIFGRGQI